MVLGLVSDSQLIAIASGREAESLPDAQLRVHLSTLNKLLINLFRKAQIRCELEHGSLSQYTTHIT